MEEKNRYIYTKIDGYYWIKDIETNENYCVDKKIVNLLNQQDKEIKTLKTKFEDRKKFCISQVKCLQDLINKLLEDNQQLKQQLSYEENAHDLCIDSFNEECEKLKKQIKFESEARERFKQSQNEKENEILKKVVDFINELAWHDVKYDAFQSTMGEFPASPSAIPRYAKKYFDLWKEMFNENLEDKIKNWGQNNGRIYKK